MKPLFGKTYMLEMKCTILIIIHHQIISNNSNNVQIFFKKAGNFLKFKTSSAITKIWLENSSKYTKKLNVSYETQVCSYFLFRCSFSNTLKDLML